MKGPPHEDREVGLSLRPGASVGGGTYPGGGLSAAPIIGDTLRKIGAGDFNCQRSAVFAGAKGAALHLEA